MRAGAEGIKVLCSGRLSGSEMARREWVREGRVPLHTLRADIDYGLAEAHTTYGVIGVKCWINKKEATEGENKDSESQPPRRAPPRLIRNVAVRGHPSALW